MSWFSKYWIFRFAFKYRWLVRALSDSLMIPQAASESVPKEKVWAPRQPRCIPEGNAKGIFETEDKRTTGKFRLREGSVRKPTAPPDQCAFWQANTSLWFFPSPYSTRDSGSIPGEGHGNTLQYSCLEDSKDRGAWHGQSKGSQRVGYDTYLIMIFSFTLQHSSGIVLKVLRGNVYDWYA